MLNDGFEQFHGFMKGWRDGCAGRARNSAVLLASADTVRDEYNNGYTIGKTTALDVSRKASERVGYVPTILRAKGDE